MKHVLHALPTHWRQVFCVIRPHHVEKVVPDDETLAVAWERAYLIHRMNRVIKSTWPDADEEDVVEDVSAEIPPMPDDLADQIRERFKEQPELPWDTVVAEIAEEVTQE